MQKKFEAISFDEVTQAFDDFFKSKLLKGGIDLNDLSVFGKLATTKFESIAISHCVHFFCCTKKKWQKYSRYFYRNQKQVCCHTKMEEEEFPSRIPFFLDDNSSSIQTALSMSDLQKIFCTHVFLSLPNFEFEQAEYRNIFHGDISSIDCQLKEWSITFFSPFERKWVRLARSLNNSFDNCRRLPKMTDEIQELVKPVVKTSKKEYEIVCPTEI